MNEDRPDRRPLTVREARPGDTETLARFNVEMALETEGKTLSPDTLRAGVAAALADPARGFYLVAEVDGDPAGGLFVTFEWSDWRNATFWWIQSVFVVPSHRGNGVYRRLHESVRERARETGGVCGLRLYVDRDNGGAQRTYRAMGMAASDYLLFEETLP